MSESTVLIAPAVLAADLLNLGRAVDAVAEAGADAVHVDVMDGQFVPMISFGDPIVKQLVSASELPIDVHLQTVTPERHIERFANAGAASITVHVEAVAHVDKVLREIRALDVRAGVAINPGTPVTAIEEILDVVDLIVVMSVNPGTSDFIERSLRKLSTVRSLLAETGHADVVVAADGGVTAETAPRLVKSGATALVAASAVFGSGDPRDAVRTLRRAATDPLAATT